MSIYTKYVILSLIVGLLFLGITVSAQKSPEIYFRTIEKDITLGSNFDVGLFLNTDSPINAYDISVAFDPEKLKVVSFNTNRSIIDVWRTGPEVFSNGIIELRGGSLKSFTGKAGELVSIKFKVKKGGDTQLSLRNPYVFLADGRGTQVEAGAPVVNINILKDETSSKTVEENKDTSPPSLLNFEITDNPINDSKLVYFRASDEDSGVSGVETRYKRWLLWSDWQISQNPASIPQDSWTVQVRAYDFQGNTTEEIKYLWKTLISKVLILVLLISVVLGGYKIFKGKII